MPKIANGGGTSKSIGATLQLSETDKGNILKLEIYVKRTIKIFWKYKSKLTNKYNIKKLEISMKRKKDSKIM